MISGGFRGGLTRRAPPSTVQNCLNFMQFFTKFGKIICWRPPGGLAPPPTGNPGSAPDDLVKMEKHNKLDTFTSLYSYSPSCMHPGRVPWPSLYQMNHQTWPEMGRYFRWREPIHHSQSPHRTPRQPAKHFMDNWREINALQEGYLCNEVNLRHFHVGI